MSSPKGYRCTNCQRRVSAQEAEHNRANHPWCEKCVANLKQTLMNYARGGN